MRTKTQQRSWLGRLPRRQRGVTLIELMTALVINFIVLAGVLQVYSAAKSAYNSQSALSELQENARLIFETVGRQVRTAGFLGCSQKVPLAYQNVLVDSSNNPVPNLFPYDFDNPLVGFDQGATLSATMAAVGPTTYGDWFSLKVPSGRGFQIFNSMNATTDTVLEVSAPAGVPYPQPGSTAIISDCIRTRVFRVDAADPGAQTITRSAAPADLGHDYNAGSAIHIGETVTFYLDEVTTGPEALRGRTLFKHVDRGPINPPLILPLVSGVERFEVLYGVDDSTGVNLRSVTRYATATEVEANGWWDRVMSLRIALLLRNIDPYGHEQSGPLTLFTGDPSYEEQIPSSALGGGYIYKVFEGTIGLRNRAI